MPIETTPAASMGCKRPYVSVACTRISNHSDNRKCAKSAGLDNAIDNTTWSHIGSRKSGQGRKRRCDDDVLKFDQTRKCGIPLECAGTVIFDEAEKPKKIFLFRRST